MTSQLTNYCYDFQIPRFLIGIAYFSDDESAESSNNEDEASDAEESEERNESEDLALLDEQLERRTASNMLHSLYFGIFGHGFKQGFLQLSNAPCCRHRLCNGR